MFAYYALAVFAVAVAAWLLTGRRPVPIPKAIKKQPRARAVVQRHSKGELECAAVLCKLFPQHAFVKVRPPWLKNPETGCNLELDFYCAELKLAVEYNGMQHYQFTPLFHKTVEDFEKQRQRDVLKAQLCRKAGVDLITLPATKTADVAGVLHTILSRKRLLANN